MAERARHISVAALNIAFEDSLLHDDAKAYGQLLQAIYQINEFVELRGERVVTLDSLSGPLTGPMTGSIVTMMNIDRWAWYNTRLHRPASETELSRIRVPANMAANYREFDFVFFPGSHRLIFLTKYGQTRLAPLTASSFIEQLCSRKAIRDRFGVVNVTIEQEPKTLEAILNADNLRTLDISIKLPNAGLGSFDAAVAESLQNMNASRGQLSLTATAGAGLKPDEPTRAAAKVALSNGDVTGTVKEEGVTKEVSTKDYPIVGTGIYRPSKESRLMAMMRTARTLLNRIVND